MKIHECMCRACVPRAFPAGPRQGPHHAADRFGDYHFRVTLNGEPLERVVLEAIGGGLGVAVVPRRPPHRCGCGSDQHCLVTLRGAVEVQQSQPGH